MLRFMSMHEPHLETPDERLAWKSVKWRNTAGWIVVAIIAVRYLIHPIANVVLVARGLDALESLPDLSLTDLGAIIGLPVGGSLADNIAGDTT